MFSWHFATIIMDDQFYKEILNFYTSSDRKYPDSVYDLPIEERCNVKSRFRQSVRPYTVENGVVMHGKTQVLLKSQVSTVLKACHDNPATGGHFGRDKTYSKVSQRYFWKG